MSISQAGEYTTSAVASRVGFFILAILNKNKMTLNPFFMESRVHHLVFTHDTETLMVNGFDETMEHYEKSYKPISFELQQ